MHRGRAVVYPPASDAASHSSGGPGIQHEPAARGRAAGGDVAELLRADLAVAGFSWRDAAVRVLALHPIWLVVAYRASCWCEDRGLRLAAGLLHGWSRAIWGADLSPSSRFGPGLHIPHPSGVVVGDDASGGRHVTLYQNVTLGARAGSNRGGRWMPTLGDDIEVGAGAVLLGAIDVGDGARVGANAVVVHDVEPGGRPKGVH